MMPERDTNKGIFFKKVTAQLCPLKDDPLSSGDLMNSIQVTFPSKQTYRTLAALIWVSWSYTSLRDRGINNSIPLSALTIVTIIVTFTT